MRKNIVAGIVAGMCLFGAVSAAQAQDHIRWTSSFSAALAQARSSHKLVLLDFYTDW